MSTSQKRPASRADIPARIEKELDTVRRLLDVLTHECIVIAADEFIDLKTQRTLTMGAQACDRLRKELFGKAPTGWFRVTSKKHGKATITSIRSTPDLRRPTAR